MRVENAIQIDKFNGAIKKALTNVYYTGYWISDRLSELLKPFGVSEQQFNVLKVLREQKCNGSNLCDIQEQMMHKMSNATRLVEKLRLKGLVTRQTCEDNRRRVDIKITEKGVNLLGEIECKLSQYQWDFESKLTLEEFEQLADLLDKLRR